MCRSAATGAREVKSLRPTGGRSFLGEKAVREPCSSAAFVCMISIDQTCDSCIICAHFLHLDPPETRLKKRLNLDLTPRTKAKLQDLQTRSDAASFTEVIRRALDLYDRVLQYQQGNGEIVLVTPDGSQEKVWILT
jgi:hypothetical protein